MQTVQDMIDQSGCAGVMAARPFLLNASYARPEGVLPQREVMRQFVRKSVQFDCVYVNIVGVIFMFRGLLQYTAIVIFPYLVVY